MNRFITGFSSAGVRCPALRVIAFFAIAFTLAIPLAICDTPAQASIVDVSGIEVPPVNGPVCVDCDDSGPAQDPDPEPDPEPEPQPNNQSNTQPITQNPQANPEPQPAPVDPEVAKREQFERDKKELLEKFAMPSELATFDSSSIPVVADNARVDDTVLGAGTIPAGLKQPGGLTDEEWKKAGECQRELDVLYKKWPLSSDEIARSEQLEAVRNVLWKKAVSLPGLTAEERERLRLEFYVRGLRSDEPAPPVVKAETIKKWKPSPPPPLGKEPTSSAPVPESVNPLMTMVLKESLVNRPTAGVEYIGQELMDNIAEDSPFGNVLGLVKVPVAYFTGGKASARAATADFLVGLIPCPQASFAVDGGRVYANVAFQSLNKFMTGALQATGGEFDKETFWSELKKESSTGMNAFMEWMGIGTD